MQTAEALPRPPPAAMGSSMHGRIEVDALNDSQVGDHGEFFFAFHLVTPFVLLS